MKHIIAIALAAVLLGIAFNASATTKPEPAPSQNQGQQQGQIQGQQQGQGQGQQQQATQNVSVRTGSPTLRAETNLNVSSHHAAQERNPVSSAFAPGMAVSNGTCYGTGGAGLTVANFSVSAGGPTLDTGCDTRYDAASLIAVGEVESAVERLCMKPEIREARRNAGRPCLADTPNAPGASFSVVCFDPSGQPYLDPLVAARACPK